MLETGSTLIDLVTGGQKGIFGLEAGTIYNLVGDFSTGKTFTATEIVAVNRLKYGEKLKWNYDNGENGNKIDTISLYGFDLMTKNDLRSSVVEDLEINIKIFLERLKKDDIGIYIIDSLDAFAPFAVKERSEKRQKAFLKGKKFEDGSYMMDKQKYLSQEFFPNITPLIEASNCLLIIISQVRDNIGVMFGNKHIRSGGKALDFYAHTIAWLAISEKLVKIIENEKITFGMRGKIKTTKTRHPRPYRECYYTILFDYGIDDLSSNIEYLFRMLTEQGKTSTGEQNQIFWKELKEILPVKEEVFFNLFLEKNATKEQLKDIEKIKNNHKLWYLEKNQVLDMVVNLKLEKIVKERVIEKWERIEDLLKTNRMKKY